MVTRHSKMACLNQIWFKNPGNLQTKITFNDGTPPRGSLKPVNNKVKSLYLSSSPKPEIGP